MTYRNAIFYLLFSCSPLFLSSLETEISSSHKLYGQPVLIFGSNLSLLGGGIGYRFHRARQGCDLSLNAMPVRTCSSEGYWPFLKASYLFFPKSRGFYLGTGANLGVFTGLLSTMGYEIMTKELLMFIQLDMTYPATSGFPIGNASLGIGF